MLLFFGLRAFQPRLSDCDIKVVCVAKALPGRALRKPLPGIRDEVLPVAVQCAFKALNLLVLRASRLLLTLKGFFGPVDLRLVRRVRIGKLQNVKPVTTDGGAAHGTRGLAVPLDSLPQVFRQQPGLARDKSLVNLAIAPICFQRSF